MKIISIVGARPQFVKLMPIVKVIDSFENGKIIHKTIHTGQHYDYLMNKVFFDELGIPEPDYNLEVGSASQGLQTGEMLKKIEDVLLKEKPDWVLVYGDTNSTLAGALAASKLHIPVAHIEAGLRSFNKRMPEEINRILTDHVSTILFCPTKTAVENLKKEGFTNIINNGEILSEDYPLDGIQFDISNPLVVNVGDIMYEVLKYSLEIAERKSDILLKLNLKQKEYYVLTMHRAENTSSVERFKELINFVIETSEGLPVIFPIHPRTQKFIEQNNIEIPEPIKVIESLSYFDMIWLSKNAKMIYTDSGGLQKEACWMGVPCVTLREETEWVETIESGWNVLWRKYNGEILTKLEKAFNINDRTSAKIINIIIKL
ncbi:MAG: UDP-N-acetyl glucosamine 2-epimerase [Hydrogenothermaceae bacterium]|nr:UDP-N-acetyl glucosamine 2-epimerase [Hydrogenothermaceae bacterium]